MDEQFDWEDADFTYEIPDCLLDGDFIEVSAICHGDKIIFELLVKDSPPESARTQLPLQVILYTGGLATAQSRNGREVKKLEARAKNGIQKHKTFELCVYSFDDRFEVLLNKEKLFIQKHLIPLPEVYALSMRGKVDVLSLEFKDFYCEEEVMSSKISDGPTQSGFVRVNELRQSSTRRKDPPIVVPMRTSSRMKRTENNVKPEVTTWKTSGDLTRPDLDVDVDRHVSNKFDSPINYRKSEHVHMQPVVANMPNYDSKHTYGYDNDVGQVSYTPPNINSQVTLRSVEGSTPKGKINLIGPRKSATLSDDKMEQRFNGGETANRVVAGEFHRGSYHVLDEQEPIVLRGNMTGSTPNLQEKPKKKRFSLHTRSRKSKGSESDVRYDSSLEKHKSKSSTSDLKDEPKKKKSLHLKNPFKRSKSKGSMETLQAGSTIQLPSATRTVSYSVNDPTWKSSTYSGELPVVAPLKADRLSKDLAKRPAADLAAYLQSTNYASDLDQVTLLGGLEYVDSTRSFSHSRNTFDDTVYQNTPQVQTSSDARLPCPQSPKSNKGEAAQMAAKIYDSHEIPFDYNTALTGSMSTPSFAYRQEDAFMTHEVEKPRRLRGNAPEIASILVDEQPSVNVARKVSITSTEKRDSLYNGKTSKAVEDTYMLQNRTSPIKSSRSSIDVATSRFANMPHNNKWDDTTLTQNGDHSFSPLIVSASQLNEQKSSKYSGSAAELAAQVENANVLNRDYFVDYNLSGTEGSVRKQPASFKNMSADYDYNLKTETVKPSYSNNIQNRYATISGSIATRDAISHNGYHRAGEYSDSEGSTVYSDAEFYLEVGKSDYYFTRKRSLKQYKSRRSMQKEREARRKLGLTRPDNHESPLSSISSLRSTDKRLTPHTYRRNTRAGVNEISDWLNNSNSPYNVRPSYIARVQAAPKIGEQVTENFLWRNFKQVLTKNSIAELPVELSSGRTVHLNGHFLMNTIKLQYCCIRLRGKDDEELGLKFRVYSNGNLDLIQVIDHEERLITTSSNFVQPNTDVDIHFRLKLITLSSYYAITSHDLFTLLVPKTFALHKVKSIYLEQDGNAQLDELFMPRGLIIPYHLTLALEPGQCKLIRLHTKFTADSQCALIEFSPACPQSHNRIKIILDFNRNVLSVNYPDGSYTNQDEIDIPFIPEQISNVSIELYGKINKNHLKTYLNKRELLDYGFDHNFEFSKLIQVRVDGDLELLNSEINELMV